MMLLPCKQRNQQDSAKVSVSPSGRFDGARIDIEEAVLASIPQPRIRAHKTLDLKAQT
jgi:hypothetical protein